MIPKINNTKRNFTSRDCLGIEGISTSMSGQICPVVNTVTPRPFFWTFIAWCFYDYYENSKPQERKIDNVRAYVKRINYYMALGTLLAGKNVVGGFPGSDSIANRISLDLSEYLYDHEYLKSTLTYYFAGLDTMKLVVAQDDETMEQYPYPKNSPEGKRLAEAFEEVISKTEFFSSYTKSLFILRTMVIWKVLLNYRSHHLINLSISSNSLTERKGI